MVSLFYILFGSLFGVGIAAPTTTSHVGTTRSDDTAAIASGDPIPPKQDPWYTPTDGWESASPGQVLRVRIAQGQLGMTVEGLAAAYNILYRTTDSNAEPSWAVTTLLIPENANIESKSLLAYQVPYDSADLDAGPSYTLSQYAPSGRTPLNCVSEIESAISAGYYVTVPDYEASLASCKSFSARETKSH